MVWVEQHHSERKKSQHFRVGSGKVPEVRKTVCEGFCNRPHHPGLITAALLVLSFPSWWGGGGDQIWTTDIWHGANMEPFLVIGLVVGEWSSVLSYLYLSEVNSVLEKCLVKGHRVDRTVQCGLIVVRLWLVWTAAQNISCVKFRYTYINTHT